MTSYEQVNIHRYLGFLQTDGHISFSFDKRDMTFRPRFGISTSEKNVKILKDFLEPWLKKNKISTVLTGRKQDSGNNYNLVVERQANVQKLIDLIQNNKLHSHVFLVDDKLFQYNALKKAFELHRLRRSLLNEVHKKELLKQIVDLRLHVMTVNRQKRNGFISQKDSEFLLESKKNLEAICKIQNSTGCASEIIKTLLKETNFQCETFLNFLEQQKINSFNSPESLKDFMFSVLEGDGSYQVCFSTNQGSTPEKRVFSGFGMLMTITDGCPNSTKKHYLLEIAKVFFENYTKPAAYPRTNANRLYLKSFREIEKIIFFAKQKKFINANDAKRFTFFEYTFVNYEAIHNNRELALFLLEKLSEYGDERYFQYSKAQRIQLVSDFFEN